jgi:histidine triad (HIT) family protein
MTFAIWINAPAPPLCLQSRVTRTVGKAFPNERIRLWHSIGEAAFQEVPHLHIDVHPRMCRDNFLRVYPGTLPAPAGQALRDAYAQRLRDISDPHRVDLNFSHP